MLASKGIEVREHVPWIGKNAEPPWGRGLPTPVRRLADGAWPYAKLMMRVPGIVGSWRCDVSWVTRGMLDGHYTLEGWLRRPLVLDVDDAIWLTNPRGEKAVARLAEAADAVFAGNSYLGEWFGQFNNRVHVVPTAVDTERFVPGEPAPDPSFVIGWIGTGGNLKYLYDIDAALAAVMAENRDAKLLVVSNVVPNFLTVPVERVEFVTWSPDVEVGCLQRMDVGIMPLRDGEWERGKCAYKMLQYMACAKPVVVSPVGMSREIVERSRVGKAAETEADWVDAIIDYSLDPALRAVHGRCGRQVVEQFYSVETVSGQLAGLFSSISRH